MAFNGKTAVILRRLRTSKNAFNDVFSYVRSLAPTELKRSIHDLSEKLADKSLLFGNPFPEKFRDLLDWRNLYQGPDRKDLIVAAAELSFFSKQLNNFVVLQTRFDRNLLAKNYDICGTVLDEVEGAFGVSLWLLEMRLSLLELQEGVEGQKKLANRLLDDPDINPHCKTMIYMFSLKAERNVTSERYFSTLSSKVAAPKTPYTHGHYLYFHLGFFSPIEPVDIHTVLLFERGSSIIDRYLTFIRVSQLIISRNDFHLRPALDTALGFIEKTIVDEKVANLCIATRHEYSSVKDGGVDITVSGAAFLRALDEYTTGNYGSVLDQCDEGIGDNEIIALADVVTRAAARTASSTKSSCIDNYALIFDQYYSLLIKRATDTTAHDQLIKIVQMFSKASWSAELFHKVLKEVPRNQGSVSGSDSIFADLNGSNFSPKLVSFYTKKHATSTKFSALQFELIKNSLTYKFLRLTNSSEADKARSFEVLGIPTSRALKYLAYDAIDAQDFISAETYLSQIFLHGDILDKQDAAAALIKTLIEANQLDNAAELAATVLIEHPNWHRKIPLTTLLDRIDSLARVERHALTKKIYLPVCYGLYSMFYGADRDEIKTIATEEFLAWTNARRPSVLKNLGISVEPKILIFFLANVCRLDTLDSHIEFENTPDVENERIRVLQWLIELDEKNKSQYTDEIAAITQRQLLLKGVQTVDKSKIYVDVEGVKLSVVKELPDLYARFQSLPNVGNTNVDDLVLQLTQTLLSTKAGLVKFLVPKNERLSALKDFYSDVRDRFVSSNEYGLDVYLSVGIRHGTLSGQLRSVFESEHLVTQKDSEGQYARNDYWISDLSNENPVDEKLIEAADRVLSDFSSVVDAEIGKLRNSIIQIRTEDKKSSGLFDFSITNEEIVALNDRITPDMQLSETIDILLGQLWEKTDISLAQVRTYLTTEFKHSFTSRINACVMELSAISIAGETQRLRNAFVSARTRLQNEVDNIATWFTREAQSSATPFEITYAIDVALEMVKRCYPQRTLNLTQRVGENVPLAGSTLPSLVYVLFFAFDNIMEHCGDQNADPTANINCTISGKTLSIELCSKIYNQIDVEKENERLTDFLKEIEKVTTSDRVRREGGTGLIKIAKTIRIDFHSQLKINFSYQDASTFSLALSIEGGKIFV